MTDYSSMDFKKTLDDLHTAIYALRKIAELDGPFELNQSKKCKDKKNDALTALATMKLIKYEEALSKMDKK